MENLGILHFIRRRTHHHIHEPAIRYTNPDLHSQLDFDPNSAAHCHHTSLQYPKQDPCPDPFGHRVAQTDFYIHCHKNFNAYSNGLVSAFRYTDAVASNDDPCHIHSIAHLGCQPHCHQNASPLTHFHLRAEQHENCFAHSKFHAIPNADCFFHTFLYEDDVAYPDLHTDIYSDGIRNRDLHAHGYSHADIYAHTDTHSSHHSGQHCLHR